MKKIYVVTGASSGIGYALCCHLANREQHVIAIARREQQLKQLKQQHPDFINVIAADLSTPEGRDNVANAISAIGKIGGLINNAATNDPVSLLGNMPLDVWHQQIATNIDAPIFLTQKLIPYLTHGRIINLTTGATNFIASGVAGYAMTKAAINVFSKYLSDELRAKNILVAAAHPGIVITDMVKRMIQNKDHSLGIVQAQEQFGSHNTYLDVNVPAKFLSWLLLDADDSLYTGDIIGVYNPKYQPLWHNETIPSPYPEHVKAP